MSGVVWHSARFVPSELPAADPCWILRLRFATRWMTLDGDVCAWVWYLDAGWWAGQFSFALVFTLPWGGCWASFGTAQGSCHQDFRKRQLGEPLIFQMLLPKTLNSHGKSS